MRGAQVLLVASRRSCLPDVRDRKPNVREVPADIAVFAARSVLWGA